MDQDDSRLKQSEVEDLRSSADKRKQSLYFPEAMLEEIKDEAMRLDRSLSWIVQRAWKSARSEIRKIPNVNGVDEESEERKAAL